MLKIGLKSIPTSIVEEVISKSISELVGEKYEVDIEKIGFGSEPSSKFLDSAKLKIHVYSSFRAGVLEENGTVN